MGLSSARSRSLRTTAAVAAGTAALLAFSASAPGTAVASGATAPAALPKPIPASHGHVLISGLSSVLPTSACLARIQIRCYTPLQYQKAYDLAPLYGSGVTGKGRTIVIVDSFGSPTIQQDLNTFDQAFGLPNTTVDVRQWGTVPPFDPKDSDQTGWAGETTLDVEYAHAIAPDAKIVLMETGVAETEGTTGFPEMMAAERYAIDHHLGDVISQSFGATENTFPDYGQHGTPSLQALRYAYVDAALHGVTVLGASGDSGATDSTTAGPLYSYKVDSWPSSDPLVTSVGGTQLTLDDQGNRLSPDVVWNDGYGAGGGGVSGVFGRPFYQNRVAGVTGDHRGTPDISMTAAVNGAAWVYQSFDPTSVGWGLVGGTSEATPIFSGIVALADQKAGHRLGLINPALYRLAEHDPAGHGIVDVTSGDNSFGNVTGYTATPGYDLASGWGTIDAPRFVDALARGW